MNANEPLNDATPVQQTAGTDIAIVGMACRFPGAANYDEYWRNLISGRNCIREIPADRWDWRRHSGVQWGGFIDDIDKFDPLFFGISPSEAAFIDPQHRLFLEAAWHAVEDAGYSVASLSGKAVGVYAGVSKNDYSEAMRESRQDIAPYVSTGTVHSILVNRVSFLFNLHGKSEAVDTACSSSLVALHNAIRDIANGDCDAAIVGGVNALISPTMFISHSKSGMLSPDGQCKTFSSDANGYVRSEGVGVLFIKSLQQALRDGDHVHAVIKSTAINHGGRSNFLTAPSTEAQALVVGKALRRGGIDPRTIDYIETHGTGTPLGDPIEINGLKKAFAQLAQEFGTDGQSGKAHCALSSAKTNVGHLESASGMAGIIKVVMALKHRRIPAIRNFAGLNPYIELEGSPFYIATEAVAWEPKEQPRRAGISSFGMGGVNAHVVLEEAPATQAAPAAEPREYVIPLSAKKGRLKAQAEALLSYLTGEQSRLTLRDVAYTLQARDVFDERLAVVASSLDELIASLGRYVAGEAVVPQNEQAAAWMQGAKADWSAQHAGSPARRVPLPTYPFARKRCWFTDVAPKAASTVAAPAEVKAEPKAEPNGSRTLKPADFFIRDHVVQGQPMLPGVMHLELARAAGSALPVRSLKDVYWIAPVVVGNDDVDLEVRLTPRNDGMSFEIRQNDTVHSKGNLAGGPAASDVRKLDVAAVRSRCGAEKNKAELYSLFREHGLAYGSTFQALQGCVYTEHELLAELQLPEDVRNTLGTYALHPSLMDGVFQAVTALSVLGLHHPGRQYIPFHLESAEIVSPLTGRCLVHAKLNNPGAQEGKWPSFDATLSDEDGNVLVTIRNLQKRPIAEKKAVETPRTMPRDIYYRPEWRTKALDQRGASSTATLLLFAQDESIAQSFSSHWTGPVVVVRPGTGYQRLNDRAYELDPRDAAGYETLLRELKAEGLAPARAAYLWGMEIQDGAAVQSALESSIYGVLHITQAAFKARLHELKLAYVHTSGHAAHSMVAGFARTLKYENPKFDYVVLGVDDPAADAIARAACAELASAAEVPALREVSNREGQRYERQIVRESVSSDIKPIELARGRVYVVAGGAGGLGRVFSSYLATKYGATIVWLGRSPLTPSIASRMAGIEQTGGKCAYFSVDITDSAALARVFEQVKSVHGGIHGVIHAAGLIKDSFILRKQRDSFARVVEPKVLGAINLDMLTQHDPLDFFVAFSSIAALMPNQGQADYAAANSFLDSFVENRNRLTAAGLRSGVSLALNWPLWADGGIRVSAEEERHLLRVFGMKPLPTPDGLEIFETSLALAKNRFPAIHQIVAIDGDKQKIEHCLGMEVPAMETSEVNLEAELKSIFASHLGVTPQSIDGARTIGELGIDSLSIAGVIRDINARFDARLNPTVLFDINTVDKLAAYLTGIGRNKLPIRAAVEAPRWNRSLVDAAQSDPARLTFSRTFQTSEFYLRDHVVDGQFNMPGACYVEMARQAGDLLLGDKSVRKLLNNYWASPLSSPKEDFTAHVQLVKKQDHYSYEIVSYSAAGEKQLHAMGQMTVAGTAVPAPERIDLAAVQSRCTEIQYPERVYEQIRGEGLHVARSFEPMKQIVLNDTEALALLELPEEVRSTDGDYVLHPSLLTGVFQTALISNRHVANNSRKYIPIGMDELEVLAAMPAECYIYCRPRPVNARNEEVRKFDLEICATDGLVVGRLKGFAIRALRELAPAVKVVEATPHVQADDAMLSAVQELIKSKLAGPIGLPVEEIDAAVQFDQYGVTSVMVVELNQIFEDLFGPISKTLFFEYRNVAELAEYFVEHHAKVLAGLVRTAPVTVNAPVVVSNAPAAISEAPVTVSDAPVAQTDAIHAYLRSLIAKPIGLPAEEIDFQTGFDQYGVNSVMVVELNEVFEGVFGPLSKTLFFEYRNIDELSQYFLEEHRDRLLAVTGKPAAVAAPVVVAAPAATVVPQAASPVEVLPAAADERHDIAIVSAAGRLPGARNLDQFWDLLRAGRDCITEIPEGRFQYRKYFDADPEQNRIYSNWGGFIDDVDRFDPTFFNISPRDAELIDPQERLLLEVVWEMLEQGGYTRQRLAKLSDRRVGVFVGALWQPYESAGIEASAAGNVVGPSSLLYSIANRVSYFLDLSGPSMAIDTACSSSLTALHLACQSIRNGESQFAIAAGVNLSLAASKYLFLSQNRFLATDGRCRSYGAGGDGYVPGEGVCAMLLKPLAKAIADGDSILAVIKGSAINHGGRTNGYTVPSPKAQGNVIAQALEQARIDPNTITYVEGHGTGTSLGDPIEIEGLGKALGRSRDAARPCAIGSVKSNIGHLEAAAGIASVLKVILQMRHGQLAPTLHTEQLNPNINFDRTPFRVVRELEPWTREQGPRRAGVSSFGAGGSNAHLILEQYEGPRPAALTGSIDASAPALFVFSAKTEEQLVETARRFNDHLRANQPANLHDVAYTLQAGREAMTERLAIVAGSVAELSAALVEFLEQRQQQNNWRRGRVASGKGARPAAIASTPFETVEAWWKGENLIRVADAWTQGLEIDWTRLYDGRNYGFLPLPTYPFADERYWIAAGASAPAAGQTTAVLHPLLHRNTSDLSEQRYGSTFTGEEFFLADHRVRTEGENVQKVLPGVAHLEIARAAVEQATPSRPEGAVLELRNTVWASPIIVTGDQQINVAVSANDNDEIEFEIYSHDGETEIVHSQGRAIWSRSSAPAPLDLDQLARQMQHNTLEQESVYEPCTRTGLALGPAFRTVTSLRLGDNQVLASLQLPAVVAGGAADYVLHPSMMDGALHGSVGMIDGWGAGSDQLRLPFALESLRVLAPCSGKMTSWVRYSAGSRPGDAVVKLDVDLCDEHGNVCVQMHGFSTRAAAKEKATGALQATTVWQTSPVEASLEASGIEYAEHHVLLCELPNVNATELSSLLAGSQTLSLQAAGAQSIAERYAEYALACFERIQSIFRSKPAGRTLLQVAIAGGPEQALLAGLSGLLDTAALENPQFAGQVVLVPAGIATGELAALLRNEKRAQDGVVRYAGGARQVVRWQEVPVTADAPVAFKDRGVYLITGGLGALGTLFANEILERAPEAKVILTGRSPLDAAKQTGLNAARISYRQLDLANLDQVRQVIAAIRGEHGRLDGILHVAGMIADGFILRKSGAQFAEVLAPKVAGTYNLDLASQDAELDFFVLFSSITSAIGNPGQADYAAANGFLDQFAAYRNRLAAEGLRHGRTRSINWPLWRAGGMGLDAATEQQLQQTTGMQAMQTATGLAAFHRALASSCDQLLVGEGNLAQMRRTLFAAPAAEPQAERPAVAAAIDQDGLAEKTQDYLRKQLSGLLKLPAHRIDPQAAMEDYGIESILAMKLVNQLEKTFGSLSKTLFFEYQTIRDLAEYFRTNHAAQLATLLTPNAVTQNAAVPSQAPVQAAAEPPAESRLTSTRRFSRTRNAAPAAAVEDDPIAIIGLSGRYPQANDLDAYWNVLTGGKDCIVEVPKSRWDWREYFSEDRTKGGHHYSKWGGFIDGVDEFDPRFFNISPREAELMDPQERLFLQHSWAAIEDAGYTRASLQIPQEGDLPGQVGVYAGVWVSEYQMYGADKRLGFAVSVASIANRVSYALNLHGPSMTLDTMCSASLTAIHLACQDLKLGRTSLAIAGGVNVSIHPGKYLMLSAAQAISTDGHCRTFGDGGDGYIPAEGVGVVVLKRLSEAKRDGDHVYGIIRGSALNHGGKTNGYTVPNPQAQTGAVGRALAESRVNARHISYIEAHGTGTKLGDPIEIAALNKAFRQHTEETAFCPIGSVKSNIGHCESAAGIAGLTKVLLQMQHGQLVPSLHSAELNPHIDFPNTPFVVNQTLRPWERPVVDGRTLPRIAGISSFGAGGSNAHLIVEEYEAPVQQSLAGGPVLILLSARTAEQLRQRAQDLLQLVRTRQGSIDLVAMAHTLQVGREAMDERLGFVVSSIEQLADRLQAYLAGELGIEDTCQGRVKRDDESLSLFTNDVDLQETIDKWIAKKKLPKLLDLWIKGLELDWSKLYGEVKPRRVSLPTYPFARERYWIDMAAPTQSAAQPVVQRTAAAVLHPLLHGNTSDLGQQRYSSTFTGAEFFLSDHQVKAEGRDAQKVLPGVAYLEMARAAIENALPEKPEAAVIELHKTIWSQPIVVRADKQVSITVTAVDADQLAYEVYSRDEQQKVVHCQGRASLSAPSAPERLDLAALRGRMGRTLDANSVYAACARMGLLYGPAFQSITAVHQGSGELLAQLRLPAVADPTVDTADYVLHPSLMDGALQAGAGLLAGWPEGPSQPRMPFALDSLRIVAPCTSGMVAWVRYAEGSRPGDAVVRLDIDLCDEQGRVCVRMNGFAARTLEGVVAKSREVRVATVPEQPAEAAAALVTLAPVWEPVMVNVNQAPRAGERVVVIGGDADQHRALRQECAGAEVLSANGRTTVEELGQQLQGVRRIDRIVWILPVAKEREASIEGLIDEQDDGVLLGFRLIKALLADGYGRGELAWTVVTNQAQRIDGARGEQIDATHASVQGLLGSMAKEYANWQVRLVDVGRGVSPWRELLRLEERGQGLAYRDGQWFRQRLVQRELATANAGATELRRGGVYVVVGGAGGIGEVLSDYLIARYDARVVWIGRRAQDAAIEQKQERIAAAGGTRPLYIAADARSHEDMTRACREIKDRHGRIDGVIHAAFVLADKGLAGMSEEQFRAGLSAKVDVAVRLAQVFGREPLDFILYFSSIQSFVTAPGQSNYAAGCTFTDAFARWQSEKAGYAVKVMNWGYWGSVGRVAGAEYQERMRRIGLGSVEPNEGLQALEQLLTEPVGQVAFLKTSSEPAARALFGSVWSEAQEARQVPVAVAVTSAPVEVSGAGLLEKVEAALVDAISVLLKVKKDDIDVHAELSEFGFDSISLTTFANQVNQTWGLELMPTIFYEHATARRFAAYLAETHRERLAEKLLGQQQTVTQSVPATQTVATPARAAVSADVPVVATVEAPAPAAGAGLLEQVEESLVDAVVALLKVKKDDIDVQAELSEFGFDSISLTALANQVNQAHGLDVMPTVFYEHATVRRFAAYLVKEHGARLAQQFQPAAVATVTTVATTPVAATAPVAAPLPAVRQRDEQAAQQSAQQIAQQGAQQGAAVAEVRTRTQAQPAASSVTEQTGTRKLVAEPIAIIGMSGKFPGAEDLDAFWENLKAGRESVQEIPRERWDWRLYGDGEDGSRNNVKWGAFIDGVDQFDPLFFGISPHEAELMDPQQRLLMMYGWKAFEDAGYGPRQLSGSRTGIFIGTAQTGYTELLATQTKTEIEGYSATGFVPSVGPNRLSYLLNLHGPSEPIETACSSSLVAVHRALRSIEDGECEMALVGGVNTLVSPATHISFSKAGMLSPDGSCKTFSSRANGYVRGEGVGMLVLKPLSAAERDGDHIYGLLRGSAENHGGRAQSLTAPNPQAQAELIKDAFRRAGVSPASVSYIEAHGTGTSLGDPVEINGLKSAFQGLQEELGETAGAGYCGLGSVKSNIGHLELAAGIAGLIKVLLQLEHKTLVPSLHCEEVNPYIRLEDSPFYIVKEARPWQGAKDAEGRDLPLRAGISSFGFGGVNAHVVVEEYAGARNDESEAPRQPVVVVLSARDGERLQEHAAQLRQAIARQGLRDHDLTALAYTLQVGREAMEHRLAMSVGSILELEAKLDAFLEAKGAAEGLYVGEVKRNNETLSVFRGDDELREAVDKWIERGKWSKVLELWVKGLEIDWERSFGGRKPRRLSLPTYPFAKEHCWVDTTPAQPVAARETATAALHPLLHRNTSDLTGQRYTSTFTGEESFLADHRVRTDGHSVNRVLPAVAYLEMVRVAMEEASPAHQKSAVLELHDTVWQKPVIVTGPTAVSVTLSLHDEDRVAFEVHSDAAGPQAVHCQGQAFFSHDTAAAKLDLERLKGRMDQGSLDPDGLYAMLDLMGLVYGPAHQGVTSVRLGRNELLAQLRLPAVVEAGSHQYGLHPSLLDSALQAAIALVIDVDGAPGQPMVPFALESLRILSACPSELVAWARYAEGSGPADRTVRLDVDLCDRQGNVCVQLRGFAARVMDDQRQAAHLVALPPLVPVKLPVAKHELSSNDQFDDEFYEKLVADIANFELSIDEAVAFG